MRVKWMKCKGDVWCKLGSVNLEHSHFDGMEGVYIIWHAGENAATVYVGKGDVKDRLAFHRTNPNIQKYANMVLYVTWAAVSESQQSGVEKFLADRLSPLEGDRHPDVAPEEVNLPW